MTRDMRGAGGYGVGTGSDTHRTVRRPPWRWIVGGGVAAGFLATALRRRRDRRDVEGAWDEIASHAPPNPPPFEIGMLDGLPDAARRFLAFAIRPGTPLRRVAELQMSGRFALGDARRHLFLPMRARQILSPPHGFVWTPRIGPEHFGIDGSDALAGDDAWSRFDLAGVVPLARGKGPDILRASTGRMLGESVWTPAALLPGSGASWEEAGENTARAAFVVRGERHAVDFAIAEDGRPLSVSFRRWSDANADKRFRFQPFGVTCEAWGSFDGFTVPTRIRGGNLFGTADYFPSYEAEIERIDYR